MNLGEWMGRERDEAARYKVLIVEDDPAVTRILRVCLTTAGFDTTQAETGREALQTMDEALFDAVLLDLGLPDGLGGSVLRRLQDVSPNGYPAWLVVSALDEDEAVRRYGPLKGTFVPKPFDPWELIRTLQGLLAQRNAAESTGNGTSPTNGHS
jgi:DNA-binding response OmpR family regulator